MTHIYLYLGVIWANFYPSVMHIEFAIVISLRLKELILSLIKRKFAWCRVSLALTSRYFRKKGKSSETVIVWTDSVWILVLSDLILGDCFGCPSQMGAGNKRQNSHWRWKRPFSWNACMERVATQLREHSSRHNSESFQQWIWPNKGEHFLGAVCKRSRIRVSKVLETGITSERVSVTQENPLGLAAGNLQ